VPQREPLSPPLLTLAGVLAAAPAAWIALAADAATTAAAASAAGFGVTGPKLGRAYLLTAGLQTSGTHAPAAWVLALLAGPVGSACLALAAHGLMQMVRGLAWLRVVILQWAAFATLRLPALLIAAVLPAGRGPVDDLYGRLGDPESGRWAVALLALFALWGAGALVARLALGVGRAWMRVDGHAFRRRLVGVVAGYPATAGLAAWSVLAPWAGPGWMAAWLVVTFGGLQLLAP